MTSAITAPHAAASTSIKLTSNKSGSPKKPLRGSSEAHQKRAATRSEEQVRENVSKAVDHEWPSIETYREVAATETTKTPRGAKAAMFEALLIRDGDTSLEALCQATGWQAHTCRAFLTGLRKKGREVIRASDKDGKSIYLIAHDPTSGPSPATVQTEAESN